MACDNCNESAPLIFNVQSFLNSTCSDCGDTQCLSSVYICYQGGNLPCSGILTGDTLETAFTKIDEQICSISGNYSTYQFNCLPDYFGQAITTEAEFVDAITSYACAIATNLQTFTGTTFPQYQSDTAAQISSIDGPSLVCSSAGVNVNDNLYTILTKYCSKFANLDGELDLSDINFGNCFSVVGSISTIHQGFTEVLSQICQVKTIAESGGTPLPTFNNVGSCLEDPTSIDSLEDTVIKLRDKVCSIDDSFDGSDITWTCNTPDGDTLQEAVQKLSDVTSTLSLGVATIYSADFVVTQTDEDNPCSGKSIALATPINQDRFVAASVTDVDPGVLIDKVTTGDGLDVNLNEDDNGIIITNTGKLRADVTDSDPLGYLVDKLEGSTVNGITITPVYNPSTKKVTLQLTIDDVTFCSAINNCVPVTCNTYSISNASGFNQTVTYTICTGGFGSLDLPTGSTVEVCAILNSVSGENVTITAIGECGTTTTTALP